MSEVTTYMDTALLMLPFSYFYATQCLYIYYTMQVSRCHQNPNQELLLDYCDGDVCKSHPLFSACANSLQILLYYDDIEVCNPLGAKRKKHKLGEVMPDICCDLALFTLTFCITGVFYFALGNVHPKFHSRFTTIQLVMLCKTSYIKKYSMNQVFHPIIDDLKKLVSFNKTMKLIDR